MSKTKQSVTSQRTIIAKGTKITGKITSENDVYIEGEINGSIRSSTRIDIKAGGKTTGDIYSPATHIKGELQGNIESDFVQLSDGGVMQGTISYKELMIDSSARFEGECQLNQEIKPKSISKT